LGVHYFQVNEDYQDPVVFIYFDGIKEAILFDCGYLFPLRLRHLQRISSIYVSHTHFDHFMGFDQFLRVNMEQERRVEMFGPRHFIEQVYHKLKGYTWNLCESIKLDFLVRELEEECYREALLVGKDAYELRQVEERALAADLITDNELYRVRFAILDHRIPTLAYSLEEKNVFRVRKEELDLLELSPGPWIKDLKEKAPTPGDSPEELHLQGRTYRRSEIERRVLEEKPGKKISYVVDTIYNRETARKVQELIEKSDAFFCEMAYLASEQDKALTNYHLTASQAALLARDGAGKKLHPLHFSKRYDKRYYELVEEGRAVFPGVEKAPRYGGS